MQNGSTSPLIAKLFCIPASSVPVEHVFSQGAIIMRPHRAKMGDDVLRYNGNYAKHQINCLLKLSGLT